MLLFRMAPLHKTLTKAICLLHTALFKSNILKLCAEKRMHFSHTTAKNLVNKQEKKQMLVTWALLMLQDYA